MGIQGLSAHKSGGWRAQWDRVLRWRSRVRLISANPDATPADRLGFFLAFWSELLRSPRLVVEG